MTTDETGKNVGGRPFKRYKKLMKLDKPFFSIDEVALILEVHPQTIRHRVKDGSLKASKSGRQWRISRADLMDFTKPCNQPKQN